MNTDGNKHQYICVYDFAGASVHGTIHVPRKISPFQARALSRYLDEAADRAECEDSPFGVTRD